MLNVARLLMLSFGFLVACFRPSTGGGLSTDGRGIIGGEAVKSEDALAKTTVLVLDLHNGDTCTGSILSARWIVTAAHCVQGKLAKDFIIGFGLVDSVVIAEPTAENRRSVQTVVPHPKFVEVARRIQQMQKEAEAAGRDIDFEALDKIQDWYDVAVLELTTDIPAGFRAVALPVESATLSAGELVQVAGYGRTIASRPPSGGTLRVTDLKIEQVPWGQTEILLDQSSGHAACSGDSGGPVLVSTPTGVTLVGVVSRGVRDHAAPCEKSMAVTSLIKFRSWILEVVGF